MWGHRGEGSRSIDLSGSHDFDGQKWGSVSQAFATTIGQIYKVSFLISGNPDGDPLPTKFLDVSVDLTAPLTEILHFRRYRE